MTNSRSLSWIDRDKWGSLLSAATQPSASAGPSSGAASSSAVTARSATARPSASPPAPRPAAGQRKPPPSVPSVPPVGPPGAAAPAPPPRKSYEPFAVAATQSLEERLQGLVTWIEGAVSCRAAFIADDNGLPVVEHVAADPGHVAAASSILMMLASVRTLMRDSGGWLSLKMSSGVLHVVEVTTRWGRFAIGVVTDDLIEQEFLTALSAAVESAFHGEMSQGESS